MSRRIGVGTGISVGAILALPATATAGDFQVTNLNDSGAGSLREALEDASMSLDPADRVLFKSKLSGEITLTSGELYINGPLEIVGPGARRLTLSGNDDFRVFYINTGAGADVMISGLRLVDGAAPSSGGGAIDSFDADLTVSEATISGNQANGGAGIATNFGSLTVRSSTISGNRANFGGGVFSYADDYGTVIENSTISGNSASSGNVGGLYIGSSAAPVDGVVRNTTIARNSAGGSGGGLYAYHADIELDGAIVADNTAGGEGPDLFGGTGAAFAGSFNLIEDLDGESVSGSGNIFGQDPKLKPLKDNGGPTDTHAFKNSPAKNNGPSDAPDKDQRGAPRKGKADIGAYEFSKCKGVVVNFVGTSGKDKLKGTKKKDGMLGLGGNDKLKGKKGKDGLCGGRGKDKLIGGPGKDKFNGGPGKDKEVQ